MKYSLFTLVLPQCSPAEAAKAIKEAGYDGVEWRCAEQPETLAPVPDCWGSNRTTLDVRKWRSMAAEHRKITHDHGLEFSNLASYCRADQPEMVKTAIEIAQTLGCPRLRICAPPYDGKQKYPEIFRKAREHFARAAELCKQAGVQGLLELHMGNIAPSAALGYRLVEGLAPGNFGIMYDPGNMVFEGYENWKLGCELLGDYLAFCHAKNGRQRVAGVTVSGAVKWGFEACEMNTGFVDWVAVFKALKSVGYDGWISNEDYGVTQGSSPERIRSGLEHLKRCETLARGE